MCAIPVGQAGIALPACGSRQIKAGTALRPFAGTPAPTGLARHFKCALSLWARLVLHCPLAGLGK
ncbi:hypothetical protein DBL05_09970 [Pseudomonas putida]|nr:hypothetical protein DBL05_09970 [Pseudomonas putida]